MTSFTFILICVHACLVQTVFGQYLGNCGCGSSAGFAPAAFITPAASIRTGAYGIGASLASAYPAPGLAYVGTGEGNVAVIGELSVGGSTIVAGQVPVLGTVTFNGAVPAAGTVSIVGNCACGCNY